MPATEGPIAAQQRAGAGTTVAKQGDPNEDFAMNQYFRFPPAVLLAMAAIWGHASAMDPPNDDAALKSQVEQAFKADHVLYARHINVSVKHGVVHLGGFVQRSVDIERAKKDAESVPGVKSVKNELSLKQGEPDSGTSG